MSSVPLDSLIRLSGGVVDASAADRLVYSSTNIVGIGIDGLPPEHLRTKCWMYFPEGNSPYYRITVFSNYSPNNVPRPGEQWSLLTEIAESPERPVDHDKLADLVVRAVCEDRLLDSPNRIVSIATRRIEHGYPTPFLGRDRVIDPILRAFERFDVYSRGRFGAWKYEVSNQDHSFAQGWECVDRLLNGGGPESEPTLFTPTVVNERKRPAPVDSVTSAAKEDRNR